MPISAATFSNRGKEAVSKSPEFETDGCSTGFASPGIEPVADACDDSLLRPQPRHNPVTNTAASYLVPIAVLLSWGTVAGHALRISRSSPIVALRYE